MSENLNTRQIEWIDEISRIRSEAFSRQELASGASDVDVQSRVVAAADSIFGGGHEDISGFMELRARRTESGLVLPGVFLRDSVMLREATIGSDHDIGRIDGQTGLVDFTKHPILYLDWLSEADLSSESPFSIAKQKALERIGNVDLGHRLNVLRMFRGSGQ